VKTSRYCVQNCFPFLLSLLFSLAGSLSFAQEAGADLSGLILDSLTLKPISGARVYLSRSYQDDSNERGEYAIMNLSKGKYRLIITATGYRTHREENFKISRSAQVHNFFLSERVGEIPGVTVRPGPFQKDMNEFIGSVRFNNEEVKRISGNLDDIIRSLAIFPGVAQIDNSRNDIIVRGGSPAENLYTVDGIIFPNINHFGNQGFSGGVMSFVNMDYVSSTSFSSGGFPVSFGDKISSVTQINLREGKSEKLGAMAVLSATQFALSLEGPITGNSTFILSARRSYLDLIFKASGFSFAPEYYDIFAKTNTKISSSSQLSLLFFGVRDRIKFFNVTYDLRDENPRAMGSKQDNYIGAITFKNIFKNGYFNLSFASSNFGYETVPNWIFEYRSVDKENSFKGDFVLNFSPEDELDIGTLARLISYKSDVKMNNYSTPFNDELVTGVQQINKEYFKGGAYAQYSHRFWHKLKLGAGLRADFFDSGINDNSISPRLFGQIYLSASTNLNFSLGVFRQAPSEIWSSLNPANENLKSTRSNQLVAGLEHNQGEDMRISLEGFYKTYHSYPVSTQRPYLIMSNTGAGFAGVDDNFSAFGMDSLVNMGKGWVKGVEFSIQKRFSGSPLWGAFNVTYSHASFLALDNIERLGSYDQRWIIHLAMGYVIDELWEVDLKFHYATGIPYTPFDEKGRQDPSLYNSARLDDQHSLDVRIDRKWNLGLGSLRTYLDIQNLYNHRTRTMIRWEKSRNRIADDPILGIVPSIGICLEI
jgi:hypothetical protein